MVDVVTTLKQGEPSCSSLSLPFIDGGIGASPGLAAEAMTGLGVPTGLVAAVYIIWQFLLNFSK
jgi:hypothetical protein